MVWGMQAWRNGEFYELHTVASCWLWKCIEEIFYEQSSWRRLKKPQVTIEYHFLEIKTSARVTHIIVILTKLKNLLRKFLAISIVVTCSYQVYYDEDLSFDFILRWRTLILISHKTWIFLILFCFLSLTLQLKLN